MVFSLFFHSAYYHVFTIHYFFWFFFQQRLYQNMVMGNMTKVFALFKTSFWLENGFSGEVVSNGGLSAIKGCAQCGNSRIFILPRFSVKSISCSMSQNNQEPLNLTKSKFSKCCTVGNIFSNFTGNQFWQIRVWKETLNFDFGKFHLNH